MISRQSGPPNPLLDSRYPVSTSRIKNRGGYLRQNWYKDRSPLGTRWSNVIIRPHAEKRIKPDAFGDQMRQRKLRTQADFRESGQSSNLSIGTITTSFGTKQLGGATTFTNPFAEKVARAKRRRGNIGEYSPVSE